MYIPGTEVCSIGVPGTGANVYSLGGGVGGMGTPGARNRLISPGPKAKNWERPGPEPMFVSRTEVCISGALGNRSRFASPNSPDLGR